MHQEHFAISVRQAARSELKNKNSSRCDIPNSKIASAGAASGR
jgi:hypothetical protein